MVENITRITQPKKELKELLKTTLIDYCTDTKVIDRVKDYFLKLGVLSGEIQDIFNQRIPLEQVSQSDIYHLANSLYNELKHDRPRLNPTYYFSDGEIEEIELTSPIKLSSVGSSLPYTIDDVTRVSPEHFVAFLDITELVDLYNKALIRYRFETQREPTVRRKKDGGLIKVPTLNVDSVDEISKRIKDGKFFTNFITLNSIYDDAFSYNSVTKELQFNRILDITDGFHRSMGMIEALTESSEELSYITGVNFTNFDIERAKQFIEQEEKKNIMDKRHVLSLDSDNKVNLVIRKINQDIYSELKDKIVTDIAYIEHGGALVTNDVMEAGIRNYFGEPKSIGQVNKLSSYLQDGFNYIIGKYTDVFYNKENHTDSVMSKSQMFVGYLFLLKLVQGSNDWENELEMLLSRIDFSVDNKAWEEIGVFKQFQSINMRRMEHYLKEVLSI